LRVGILGAGGIANAHSVAWSAAAGRGEIAAYADVFTDRAQELSNQYTGGKAKVYASPEELFADGDIDVVDVCLPHHLHTDAVIGAAQAGKAILCEKPLTTNLPDAVRIAKVLEETGVVFMGAHNQLFQPALLEARRLMTAGMLGRPFFFRSIETFQSRRWAPFAQDGASTGGGQSGWRADLKTSGGGELLDTGYHGTYRLLSLANNDRPVEVIGVLSRFLLGHLPTEDTGQVIVRFESGAIGEIITSWAFDVVDGRIFEVSAEFGALAATATSLEHQFYTWPEASSRSFQPVHTFTAEISHFIDVVTKGADNPAPIDLTTRVLQVIKGAYLSAQAGQTVTLPEDPTQAPTVGGGASTPYSVVVPDEVIG
jgi:predicted dehydrogenase